MVLPSCVESLLNQNPTLIHLRHAKSFVPRAACKVPHCQKWDCHALPLFALDRAIPRLFSRVGTYDTFYGYGTVGTVGTVRWGTVRWGTVRWYGGYGTVGTVQRVQWVRYGGYGTVGTVRCVQVRTHLFFPSNARWLSPGRLSSRKDNCIVQIHRIKAAATLVIMTM